jgi:hypothetical protein
MPSQAHKRFFKNFDYDKLSLKLDQRGFVVGRSRLGITRIGTGGDIVEIKDDFISIQISIACRVNEGLWIEPEVSSLTLVSRNPMLFATLDDYPLEFSYDDVVVFSGSIIESTVDSEIGEDNTEEFTVTLTARGFELIRNTLPAYGTGGFVWNVVDNVDTYTPVTEFAEGKVWQRASAITGLPVVGEDARALVQLEERVAADESVGGEQGALLNELAQRSGLLVDASDGESVKFRSYQGVPLWEITDEHVISGFTVALDRDSSDAVIVTRAEQDTYVRAYRAGSSKSVAQVDISTRFNNSWDMQSVPAYAPLVSSPPKYLTSCTIPRTDDLALVSRLPIAATFTHGSDVYGGSIIGMNHSISTQRWMMDIDLAGPQLTSRIGDLSPLAPIDLAADLDLNTATITWTQPDGPPNVNWQVWYQQSPQAPDGSENYQIGPTTAPHDDGTYGGATQSITVSTPTATISGLASGKDYRFTVYAIGTTRSAPSLPLELTVPGVPDLPGGDPDSDLDIDVDDVTEDEITYSWTWTGETPDGFKVGRDNLDRNGYGAYQTTLANSITSVTFDKLIAGRKYNIFVAPVLNDVELARVQMAVTTDSPAVPDPGTPGLPQDPDDPITPSGRIPLVAPKFSKLKFNSVCFLPNTSAAGAVQFGVDRGRPMDGLLFFVGRGSWGEMQTLQSDHPAWVQSGHLLIATMPHAPQSLGTGMNVAGANNAYAANQRALGAAFAAKGLNRPEFCIRVDWEANGDWYEWSAKNGGPSALKQAIRNFVTNVRAGGLTRASFSLCYNKGGSQAGSDFEYFPGADVIDVVGVDAYDWWNATFNDSQWTENINRRPGLKTVRDFAVNNGIQWSLDEGGNVHKSPGGGDNPYYWQKMWDFINDPANLPYCAWHNTYNEQGAPKELQHQFAANPVSFEYYSQNTRWGGF